MKRIATVIALCAPLLAWAQGWPSARPITLIVPFTPGGNVDFAGRVLATRLQDRLKQNVIVENVAGAGGIVGVQRAVQATADGYTLLIGVDSPISIARFVTPSAVRYDPQRDLAPIGMLNAAPMIIVGRPGLPANDFGELLRLARTQPGKLSYGTSGVGTVLHLAMERVKILAGIDILHVPYKGGAPIVTDLIGNQVDLAMLVTVATLPQVKSGKIKAFAVTTPQRVPQAPEIPTLTEFPELRGFDMVAWTGLFAPAKTPSAIVARLQQETARVVRLPDVKEGLARLGVDPVGASSEELASRLARDLAKWTAVAKAANIRND